MICFRFPDIFQICSVHILDNIHIYSIKIITKHKKQNFTEIVQNMHGNYLATIRKTNTNTTKPL
ncbi:hypothetical protein C1645_487322 [Glomus cerebriforme]|uniref:Uncharacterized protein n=1 Tax=Glomus cerebriforme TaxID=658196 RepID=A0A397SAD3_9GLOM|nr:hypothetical protein C1645_487322 [Glomus cerebriforme]